MRSRPRFSAFLFSASSLLLTAALLGSTAARADIIATASKSTPQSAAGMNYSVTIDSSSDGATAYVTITDTNPLPPSSSSANNNLTPETLVVTLPAPTSTKFGLAPTSATTSVAAKVEGQYVVFATDKSVNGGHNTAARVSKFSCPTVHATQALLDSYINSLTLTLVPARTPLGVLYSDRLDTDLHGLRILAAGGTKNEFTRDYSTTAYDPSTGAVSPNNEYPGESSTYYVEEQGSAGYMLMAGTGAAGMDQPDVAIAQNMLSWAQEQQTDGTGQYVNCGDIDHSTYVYLCKAVLAADAVQDPGLGGALASAVAPYVDGLEAASAWGASDPDYSKAQKSDYDYSHRRSMHASVWLATDQLEGNTDLDSLAQKSIQDYIAQELSGGWRQANQAPDSSGNDVSAILVAPGKPLPKSYTSVLPADGVMPEHDDYGHIDTSWPQTRGSDSSYQSVGLLFAAYCLAMMPPSTLRTNLDTTCISAGNWLLSRQESNGSMDITGDCRTGIGTNRNDSTKSYDYGDASRSLIALYYATGQESFYTAAIAMGKYMDSSLASDTGSFDWLTLARARRAAYLAGLP